MSVDNQPDPKALADRASIHPPPGKKRKKRVKQEQDI